MRAFSVVGAVVIAAAAAIVPLPWVVEAPADVVDVGGAISVTLDRSLQQERDAAPSTVQGAFLGPRRGNGAPSLLELVAAGVAPGQTVRTRDPLPRRVLGRTPTVAALRGLGLSPARMQGAGIPVRVQVAPAVDPASLAAALHVFDTAAAVDVARGRRIGATGTVWPDETLHCGARPAATAAALRAAGAEMVVVPQDCPSDVAGVGVVRVTTFLDAIDALVAK